MLTEFTCSACNYRSSSRVCSGHFEYHVDDEVAQVNRDIGWCNECEGITAVERLPSAADFQHLEQRITSVEATAAAITPKAKSEQTFVRRMLGRQGPNTMRLQDLEWEANRLKERLEELRQRYRLLGGRTSPRRCLYCGSTSLLSSTFGVLHGEEDVENVKVSTGVTHPGCGGMLMAARVDIDFVSGYKCMVYDREGRLVETLRQRR